MSEMKKGDRVIVNVRCRQKQRDGSVIDYKGAEGVIANASVQCADVVLDSLPGKALFFVKSELLPAPPKAPS